jgi:predicted deacylase
MIEFALPSLGADMDEGMLVAWLVQPGDRVEYGQVIAEVETDKGIIEIEARRSIHAPASARRRPALGIALADLPRGRKAP